MKHYTEDGLYDGPKHKMDDGASHTGKTHTKTSKLISHKRKGPFTMKTPLYQVGLGMSVSRMNLDRFKQKGMPEGMSKVSSGFMKKADQEGKNKNSSPLEKAASCWKGYKAVGKKKSPSGKKTKGGKPKMVNNCVKIGKKR